MTHTDAIHDKTRKALEKSIRHWGKNIAAETPEQADVSSSTCALCNKFLTYIDGHRNCSDCPVANFTGQSRCKGSPYEEAARRLHTWRNERTQAARDAWRKAAQVELDFLTTLYED